jgi:phosphatidate cytidylyltransferase
MFFELITLLIGILFFEFGFVSLAKARIEDSVIWTTDFGAYFIGRKFSKRKFEISPNKTIEGAIGGIITALTLVCLNFGKSIRKFS